MKIESGFKIWEVTLNPEEELAMNRVVLKYAKSSFTKARALENARTYLN